MNNAFVLAAGFGTRLRPLTEHLPKPLVPVCGVPMLAYALALCARHGLTDVIVNAHWMAETLRPWEGRHEGVNVTLSVEEPDILGTGGGLKKVAGSLADRFAIVNADVLSDVDLGELVRRVPTGGAAMALRPHDADRYGVVAADSTGIVVQLVKVAQAKPSGEVDTSTHFTGVHAMHIDTMDLIPDGFAGVVRTAYKELVPKRAVAGLVHEGVWLDVGDPKAYLDTNLAVLAGKVALALNPMGRAAWARSKSHTFGDPSVGNGAIVRKDVWLGADVQVEGSIIENSIVGDGAVVPSGAVLVESVVWPGCTVPDGVNERVVIHPGGVLPC